MHKRLHLVHLNVNKKHLNSYITNIFDYMYFHQRFHLFIMIIFFHKNVLFCTSLRIFSQLSPFLQSNENSVKKAL